MPDTALHPAPTLDDLHAHRAEILALAERYGAYNVRVFGSVARGDATPDNDVDLLVNLPSHFSLLDLSELVGALQTLLGCPVQIASAAHLRDELRPYILRDVVSL